MKPSDALLAVYSVGLMFFARRGAAIYTNQVNGPVRAHVEQIAVALQKAPDFLVAVMAFETVKPAPPKGLFHRNSKSRRGSHLSDSIHAENGNEFGGDDDQLKAMTTLEQMGTSLC